MALRVLDLFSGIGGFSLGLERAGMKTVQFVEIDPFCQKVLKKHWPEVPIHDDIRSFRGERGSADVICGGFPCQGFSVAGKQLGKADDRYLWPEMHRIIREVQPRFVIGENVTGIINLALDDVLSDLEALGYACGAFVIPACAVDARHRRDRVWILGDRDREPASAEHDEASWVCGYAADSDSERRGAEQVGIPWSQGSPKPRNDGETGPVAKPNGAFGEGDKCAERGGEERTDTGEHSRWEPESGFRRVANGVPNRSHRLRALGNSVVPQVVEMIGRAICQA